MPVCAAFAFMHGDTAEKSSAAARNSDVIFFIISSPVIISTIICENVYLTLIILFCLFLVNKLNKFKQIVSKKG